MKVDVLVDARRATWNPSTGTGIYATNLISNLSRLKSGVRISVLDRSRIVDLRWAKQDLLARFTRWPRKLLSDLVEVPLASRSAALTHHLYPEGAAIGSRVVTIHDLSVLGSLRIRGASAPYYRWRALALAQRADRIICPSDAVARAVSIEFRPRGQIRTIHMGVDIPEDWESLVPDSDRPYVLYTGGLARRKNVGALLKAWEIFRPSFQGELLITGPGRPEAGALTVAGTRFLGEVTRSKLWRLYSGAEAVVYPSLEEGFGFPILEGALLGRPVVCGSVGVVPELPYDLVLQVDVRNPGEIVEGLRTVTNGWRPSPVALGKGRSMFSWTRCAQETLAVYQECL